MYRSHVLRRTVRGGTGSSLVVHVARVEEVDDCSGGDDLTFVGDVEKVLGNENGQPRRSVRRDLDGAGMQSDADLEAVSEEFGLEWRDEIDRGTRGGESGALTESPLTWHA